MWRSTGCIARRTAQTIPCLVARNSIFNSNRSPMACSCRWLCLRTPCGWRARRVHFRQADRPALGISVAAFVILPFGPIILNWGGSTHTLAKDGGEVVAQLARGFLALASLPLAPFSAAERAQSRGDADLCSACGSSARGERLPSSGTVGAPTRNRCGNAPLAGTTADIQACVTVSRPSR